MDVKLLAELKVGGYAPPLVRPDGYGVTVKEYAAANYCGDDTARAILNKALREGILDMHKMVVPGINAAVAVYHRIGEYPPGL